jgi:hypothetical protein
VISVGVPTPILFAFTSWRLRHLQISTTLATPPRQPGDELLVASRGVVDGRRLKGH